MPMYRYWSPEATVVTAQTSVTARSGRLPLPGSQRLRLRGKRRDREEVDDRQDLDRRVRLADRRRPDVARIEQEEVDQAPHEDDDVPADHHDGEPQGDDVDVGEDDEGGRHQQLVGDRVEERPDQRPLPQPAGPAGRRARPSPRRRRRPASAVFPLPEIRRKAKYGTRRTRTAVSPLAMLIRRAASNRSLAGGGTIVPFRSASVAPGSPSPTSRKSAGPLPAAASREAKVVLVHQEDDRLLAERQFPEDRVHRSDVALHRVGASVDDVEEEVRLPDPLERREERLPQFGPEGRG